MRILALLLIAACGLAATSATGPTSKPVLPSAPDGVTIRQDVAYLPPDRKEKLDLYLRSNRDKSARSPAVLIIHGGGWVGGDKAAAREFNIGTTLALHGYVAASVNYWMNVKDRWPTNLQDCKNAVRYLRKHAEELQIDPDRIGVIGGSAGGHLALMVAYTSDVKELEPDQPYPGVSDRVRGVVDMYGITDLLTRRKTDEQGTPIGEPVQTSALLPTKASEDRATWELASPVYHINASTPPTLILHGRADTTVDRDQSIELAEKLKAANVEHELILLDGIGHTFDLQTWRRKPLPRDLRPVVLDFFDTHLK